MLVGIVMVSLNGLFPSRPLWRHTRSWTW